MAELSVIPKVEILKVMETNIKFVIVGSLVLLISKVERIMCDLKLLDF